MRPRVYYFLALLFGFGGAVLSWMSGEVGFVLYGLLFGEAIMAGFAYTHQARNASPKIMGQFISTSIEPGVKKATLPAIGKHGLGVVFEECWAIPLGGAKLNGIVIPSGHEYGFLVIAKRLLYEIDGQYVFFAHTIPLPPHQRAIWNTLNRMKPVGDDARTMIPQPWLAILTQMEGWTPKAPVFMALDASNPVIMPGDPKRPVLEVPLVGAVPLWDLHVKLPDGSFKPLSALLPPDRPLIDLREEHRIKANNDLAAARKDYGEMEATFLKKHKRQEAIVTSLTEIEDKVSGVGFPGGQFLDNALGEEESATGRG